MNNKSTTTVLNKDNQNQHLTNQLIDLQHQTLLASCTIKSIADSLADFQDDEIQNLSANLSIVSHHLDSLTR